MQSLSVLIVDDNEVDRHLLVRDLTRTEVDVFVQEATNGAEAIDFLSAYEENCAKLGDRFPPQLIFIDINMPIVGGFEFLERFEALRADEDRYGSCVIMMFSSSERPDERRRAMGFEFVKDFIVKGRTTRDELKQKVLDLVA